MDARDLLIDGRHSWYMPDDDTNMGTPRWQNLGSSVEKYFTPVPHFKNLVVHPWRSIVKRFGVTRTTRTRLPAPDLPAADDTLSHYKCA